MDVDIKPCSQFFNWDMMIINVKFLFQLLQIAYSLVRSPNKVFPQFWLKKMKIISFYNVTMMTAEDFTICTMSRDYCSSENALFSSIVQSASKKGVPAMRKSSFYWQWKCKEKTTSSKEVKKKGNVEILPYTVPRRRSDLDRGCHQNKMSDFSVKSKI